MPAQSNVARPYAQALFELALERDALAGWDDQIRLLAAVADDPAIAGLTHDPRVSATRLSALIIDVCGDRLDQEGKNLVRLLVRNNRVNAIQDIAYAYAARRADAEKVVVAQMTTAAPLSEPRQKQFAEALQSKLGRSVNLEFEVDEELIGGAVIRAGDRVIDGSVKAQLEQLGIALGA